jgi:hypothetical protein
VIPSIGVHFRSGIELSGDFEPSPLLTDCGKYQAAFQLFQGIPDGAN